MPAVCGFWIISKTINGVSSERVWKLSPERAFLLRHPGSNPFSDTCTFSFSNPNHQNCCLIFIIAFFVYRISTSKSDSYITSQNDFWYTCYISVSLPTFADIHQAFPDGFNFNPLQMRPRVTDLSIQTFIPLTYRTMFFPIYAGTLAKLATAP